MRIESSSWMQWYARLDYLVRSNVYSLWLWLPVVCFIGITYILVQVCVYYIRKSPVREVRAKRRRSPEVQRGKRAAAAAAAAAVQHDDVTSQRSENNHGNNNITDNDSTTTTTTHARQAFQRKKRRTQSMPEQHGHEPMFHLPDEVVPTVTIAAAAVQGEGSAYAFTAAPGTGDQPGLKPEFASNASRAMGRLNTAFNSATNYVRPSFMIRPVVHPKAL